MAKMSRQQLVGRVEIGGPGFTDEERQHITSDRDTFSERNLVLIQKLNRRGVQVDMGLEAITQFRTFLQDIGVITPDQRLAAEMSWELQLNQQLRASYQQVVQLQAQQAAQEQLITPPGAGGIVLPPGVGGN